MCAKRLAHCLSFSHVGMHTSCIMGCCEHTCGLRTLSNTCTLGLCIVSVALQLPRGTILCTHYVHVSYTHWSEIWVSEGLTSGETHIPNLSPSYVTAHNNPHVDTFLDPKVFCENCIPASDILFFPGENLVATIGGVIGRNIRDPEYCVFILVSLKTQNINIKSN